MAGFGKHLSALAAVGAKVVAASVDAPDKAKEVADEVGFPIAFGVTREQADALGAWWEERRGIIQPSEFLVAADGRVVSSTYSSGPIGRVEATDVVKLIDFREKQAQKK